MKTRLFLCSGLVLSASLFFGFRLLIGQHARVQNWERGRDTEATFASLSRSVVSGDASWFIEDSRQLRAWSSWKEHPSALVDLNNDVVSLANQVIEHPDIWALKTPSELHRRRALAVRCSEMRAVISARLGKEPRADFGWKLQAGLCCFLALLGAVGCGLGVSPGEGPSAGVVPELDKDVRRLP